MTTMTNKQHWNKGFFLGLAGKKPRRVLAGPKVTPAFASGYRIGLVAFWQRVCSQLGYNYGPGGFVKFYASNVQTLPPAEAYQLIAVFREHYPLCNQTFKN